MWLKRMCDKQSKSIPQFVSWKSLFCWRHANSGSECSVINFFFHLVEETGGLQDRKKIIQDCTDGPKAMKLYIGNLGDDGKITSSDLRPLFEQVSFEFLIKINTAICISKAWFCTYLVIFFVIFSSLAQCQNANASRTMPLYTWTMEKKPPRLSV